MFLYHNPKLGLDIVLILYAVSYTHLDVYKRQALTEERRKEYAKNVWKFAEHAKVAIRNIRRDANDEIKKCDGSEDEIKDGQNRVQKLTDKFVKEVDEIGKVKEKDIMTV